MRASSSLLSASPPKPSRLSKPSPPTKLVAASKATNYCCPVVDEGLLPRHPFDPDAPSISRNIPFMVGTSHDGESRLPIGRNNPSYFVDLTWDNLHGTLAKVCTGSMERSQSRRGRRHVPQERPNPHHRQRRLLFAPPPTRAIGARPMEEIERRAAQPAGSAPTYSYQIDWGSPVHPELRACHAIDIPFLFDNVALANSLSGTGPEAQLLADQISETYIAFARTGNPNNPKIPHWPAYDLTHRSTMVFNVTSKVVDDPRPGPRKLFGTVHYENPGT